MHFSPDFYGFLEILYRYAVGFLGIVLAFYIAKALSKTKIEYILGFIGAFSLDIYLIQRYILEGLFPRFVSHYHINFDFTSAWTLALIVPLLTLFFVALCLGVSKFFLRRNHLLNRLLLGHRI
jgi:hypothetical protein